MIFFFFKGTGEFNKVRIKCELLGKLPHLRQPKLGRPQCEGHPGYGGVGGLEHCAVGV